MTRWPAIALLAVLTACQTIPLPSSNPRQVWCDHNAPRSISNPDTAPRSEIDAVNNHNDQGIAWCGWKVQ